MKEIKFRGFGIFEWVYGFLVKDSDKCYIVGEVETSNDYGEGTDLYAVEWYEVTPESVGQFTGLHDKNGKEIYEGDLVILNSSHKVLEATFEPELSVVQWREKSPTMDMLNIKYINHDRKIGLTFDNGMVDEIEVVGNIYEHSHLLKEEVK